MPFLIFPPPVVEKETRKKNQEKEKQKHMTKNKTEQNKTRKKKLLFPASFEQSFPPLPPFFDQSISIAIRSIDLLSIPI